MAVKIMAVLVATGIAVPLVPGPAAADPVLNGEFPVSAVSSNNQIAAGPDGNMWVTLDGVAADVARITPAGVVTEFDAANMTTPIGITAGPDGRLWVTQTGGVARFLPSNPVAAEKFAIAAIADARGITLGPDGNLWTASVDKVLKISPGDPAAPTVFAGTGITGARAIAAGTDGNLWVADFGSEAVYRITTAGIATKFPAGGGTQGVAAGANGQVAFTQQGTPPYTIGRITTVVETTPVPGTDPFGITFGADGAYWAAQFATNSLARVTATGALTTLALPAGSGPRQIAPGPGDTLWVTLDTAEKVARVSGVSPAPAPTPTPTPTPTPGVATSLTKKPKKKVSKAKVRFRFTGTAGASFQCRLDKRPWRNCGSPKTYRVKTGKHVFRVRAVVNGIPDSSPAKWRFRRV